jgi:abequosyltransferase
MIQKKNILLTIAIPTWNRSKYLYRCLDSIFKQINSHTENYLEVIVSDNSSIDNTASVVHSFVKKGFKLKYFKNRSNLGGDYNLAKCYSKAEGTYVYMLADDDILMPNMLNNLISIIKNNSKIGLVFLSPFGFDKEPSKEKPYSLTRNKYYYNSNKFIKKIGVKMTLISTLVINKELDKNDNPFAYCGSELVQVHLALNAILRAKTNVYVSNYSVGILRNNGGNNYLPSKSDRGMRSYNPCFVFGIKLPKVLRSYLDNGINQNTINFFEKNILFYYLPKYIFIQMVQNSDYFKESMFALNKAFDKNIWYLVFFKPVFYFFYPINIFVCLILIIFGKVIYERHTILLNHLRLFRLKIF